MSRPSTVERGRRGEALVAESLESMGWRVLDRNWRDGPRELDLVVYRPGVLAFVEVKTRRCLGKEAARLVEEALLSVTPRKRRDVERAAQAWLGLLAEEVREGTLASPDLAWPREIRFDVAVVILEAGRNDLTYLTDAWRPGWDVG